MFILSLLILFLIGFIVVNIFWTEENILSYLGFKICIAFGIGTGITSIMYFFQKLFINGNFKAVFISEMFLLLILFVILFFKKPKFKISNKKDMPKSKSILSKIISISFYITTFSALLSFITYSLKNPHGTWDAWAIWNLHARFIYRLSGHLGNFFKNSPDWSHSDYPVLLPAAIARFNQYIGHEQLLSSSFVALLFTLGLVFLLTTSLSILKTKNQGYLAGMVMLSTFIFIQLATIQCADIPIAFFFLASLVLLCLKDKFNNNSFLILAGLMAGLSAWCKNEGLLFIVSVFLARFIVVWVKNGIKLALKEVSLLFTGLFPLLIGLIYFKIWLAPANDIFLHQSMAGILSKITNPARYSEIFSQLLINVNYYFCRLTGIPLLVLYAFLTGINTKSVNKISINTVAITLFFMLTGYLGVYLITPHDLYWHLSTSLYRLLLQLWPVFLLLYFLIVKTPEENFINKLNEKNA